MSSAKKVVEVLFARPRMLLVGVFQRDLCERVQFVRERALYPTFLIFDESVDNPFKLRVAEVQLAPGQQRVSWTARQNLR